MQSNLSSIVFKSMRQLPTFLLFATLGLLICGACCRKQITREGKCYPHKKGICFNDGTPKNDRVAYLPDSFYVENKWIKNRVNQYITECYSGLMHCAQEPILYNRYIGRPVIRYTNFAGITIPVTVTVTQKNHKWFITTIIYTQNWEPDSSYIFDLNLKFIKAVPNEKVRVKKRIERQLSWNEWRTFWQKLDSLGYPDMSGLSKERSPIAVCGSTNYFEIHTKSHYFFTDQPDFIVDELLRLSAYDEYWEKQGS